MGASYHTQKVEFIGLRWKNAHYYTTSNSITNVMVEENIEFTHNQKQKFTLRRGKAEIAVWCVYLLS
jgi:hypothetical protein